MKTIWLTFNCDINSYNIINVYLNADDNVMFTFEMDQTKIYLL